MKIQEYQAKDLFRNFDIPVQNSKLCTTVDQVVEAYQEFNSMIAVKAQVLAGGRGKAGGIKLAKSADEARQAAQHILGMDIKGYTVDKVLACKAVDIEKEFYIGFVNDRNTKSIMLMASAEGGVEIEEVAKTSPEKIIKVPIDPAIGMKPYQARNVALKLKNDIGFANKTADILMKLYKCYVHYDSTLAEINPLVITDSQDVIALDGKMNFDDNAIYRQPEIEALFEPDEDEKLEIEAKERGLTYIKLDGNIGCMVNGAGLAMATMDMIKLYGGEPANFLDIGGSSNPQKVVDAMELITRDKNVKVVMINIFGGITRGDDVARGLVEAMKQVKSDIPVVVRLTGTNAAEGHEILSQTKLTSVETMDEAAQKAIQLAN